MKQVSFRLSERAASQLVLLSKAWGCTKTNAIETALDRVYQQENTMSEYTARQSRQAQDDHDVHEIVKYIERMEYQPIGDTTIVGRNAEGEFWVTDNGEEVAGLSSAEAERIVCENLGIEY